MKIYTYLNYCRNCRQAFEFYAEHLGGKITMITPPDRFQPIRSAYLSLMADSVEQAERVYALLTQDGQIFMPMEETFFARRFAMFRDRFGTSWMLLHEK